MSYTSDYVLNEENIASFLKDAVSKVESANDSEIKALEQIKKLIKKNIPFTRRKYVFAYLIKQSSAFYRGNKNSRFAKKPFEKKSLRSESAAERKEKRKEEARQWLEEYDRNSKRICDDEEFLKMQDNI